MMESMDDLDLPPKSGAEIAERKRVLKIAVNMRGDARNTWMASAEQVYLLTTMGMPWREAMQESRDGASAFIWRYKADSDTMKRRYEATVTSGGKPRCSCPHCLGHD